MRDRQPGAGLCPECGQEVSPGSLAEHFRKGHSHSHANLLADAAREGATVCPGCCALIPPPGPILPPPLNLYAGRLSGAGYRVECDESGLRSRVTVEGPDGRWTDLPPIRRRLTARGAVLLIVGPVVLTALALAVGLDEVPPLVPVGATLGLAVVLRGLLFFLLGQKRAAADEAVDLAWEGVVGRMIQRRAVEREFLTRLALVSPRRGRPMLRKKLLAQLLRDYQDDPATLAALSRLAIEDRQAAGEDPVPAVAAAVGQALKGALPLDFAAALLENWQAPWWGPGALARCRALICDRAFELGFEVRHLLELGAAWPALGAALRTDQPRLLLALRLLWALRAQRPWDASGQARNVFQLAGEPTSEPLLELHPDLLLWLEDPALALQETASPLRLILTPEAVWIQGLPFDRPVAVLEIGDHVLQVGEVVFRCRQDTGDIATRLRRWFSFLFEEFQPRLESVRDWRSPPEGAALRARRAIACPRCGFPCIPSPAAVALPLRD